MVVTTNNSTEWNQNTALKGYASKIKQLRNSFVPKQKPFELSTRWLIRLERLGTTYKGIMIGYELFWRRFKNHMQSQNELNSNSFDKTPMFCQKVVLFWWPPAEQTKIYPRARKMFWKLTSLLKASILFPIASPLPHSIQMSSTAESNE